ncbi:aldehyde dehydrogenase family protein [Gordonia sp. TBRC 11910]|uniref:Aldehyde dehydrogenase family protein n=1 Tax=Gordonia asplenii TaxID=2725283 RepID=A0A848L6I5_9ACTN|nr:aldehyde dehydrogenase family protein [Gordonia asplenii]NMO03218.1 aldehyde dehydrogenase family protein [Gordonia asplenii]
MTSTSTVQLGQARNPKVAAWLDGRKPSLLINNEWVPAQSGKTFDTVNPATEQVLAVAAEAAAADVDAAVKAAGAAFTEGPWSKMGPAQRARLLRAFAALIEENTDELAELESLDNGMTFATAQAFIGVAVESMYYFAGAAQQIFGQTSPSAPTNFNYVLREPIGVVGAIIPWNAPITAAVWKIAPILAAGNTMILKPAEQTPLTALRLGELAIEAGLPAGVLNILTGFGPGAGSAIAEHPQIDKITFTGSVQTGRTILRASTGNLKRVTLELGGKSPNIVFPDADMEGALANSLAGFATISGQVCVAGTRLFVQRDIKDEFVENLSAYAAGIKVGDPLDPETTMGPLASREQYERVTGYLDLGKSEGAVAASGGNAIDGKGYFVQPTIFDGVDNSMRIAQEEIFGPVVSVIPFTDEYDAVLQGNDTTYGLAAAVWTRDVSRAHQVARQIKAGTVWINTFLELDPTMPFGGYKESGLGREFGANWYQHYTEEKSVFLKL